MSTHFSRRQLLKRAAVAAGAASAARLFRAPAVLAEKSPNSKLATVVIGCGGRGSAAHVPEAARERLVAVVDAHEGKTAKALDYVSKNAAKFKLADFKTSSVKAFTDYRKMFDEMGKTIDAVFIATTNHHHFLPSMIAMQLGKGVYVEKPMSHLVWEARALAEAARKYKVPTQMGNQGHCDEGYRKLCEYIWSGAIGKVAEVHTWSSCANGGIGPRPPTEPVPAGMNWDSWIGPSPFRDYHKYLDPHEWHGWWDFGSGSLGNRGCHIMDGAVWALNLRYPATITAEQIIGGTDERFAVGTRIRWDFPARQAAMGGNTCEPTTQPARAKEMLPPVKVYWWDGKRSNKPATGPAAEEVAGESREDLPPGTFMEKGIPRGQQNRPLIVEELEKKYNTAKTPCNLGGDGAIYIGDKGILCTTTMYGGGVRFLPPELKDSTPTPPQMIPRVKGGSFGNFLEACRAGKPATFSNFDVASILTEVTLLGNLAEKAGVNKPVEWDGPNMKVVNRPELNAWVKREYRKGWSA